MEKLYIYDSAEGDGSNNNGLEKEEFPQLQKNAVLPGALMENHDEVTAFDKGVTGEVVDHVADSAGNKFKKYLKILLASAVFVFGGKVAYEEHEEGERAKETKEASEYVIKIGLQERAEKAGFDVRVDVPNGDGPYIAHIGYKHLFTVDSASTSLLNAIGHDQVMKANTAAEKFLLSLKESSSQESNSAPRAIFLEGFDEKSSTFFEFMDSIISNINSIDVDGKTMEHLTGVVDNLTLIKNLPSCGKISIEYLLYKKLNELLASDVVIEEKQMRQLRDVCLRVLGSFNMQTVSDRIIQQGASIKAYLDGKYKIIPIESSEILDEIKREEQKLKLLADRLNDLAIKAKNGSVEAKIEYAKVAVEYRALSGDLHERLILKKREDFAVRFIKDTVVQQRLDHGIVLMHYGIGHDYSDNVIESNHSGNNGKIGLITLVPKGYTGTRE